jgi:anti-sigma B factor antagonist
MTEALTFSIRREPDYTVVTVSGEIDMVTVGRLREQLFELAASGEPVVADLDRVSFIDSTGLGVLVGTVKRAAAHGGSFQVVSAQPNFWRVFRMAGLDSAIPLTRTLAEAQQALADRDAPGSAPAADVRPAH